MIHRNDINSMAVEWVHLYMVNELVIQSVIEKTDKCEYPTME